MTKITVTFDMVDKAYNHWVKTKQLEERVYTNWLRKEYGLKLLDYEAGSGRIETYIFECYDKKKAAMFLLRWS